MIHKSGKNVFMHSDENFEEIYSDIFETGVDVVNS